MKQYLPLPAVTILLLVSCSGTPMRNPDTPATATTTTAASAHPIRTSTPTPPGTWEMVIQGMIYDQSTGKPISGASIRYIVLSSYFREIQEGRLNKTISNEQGEFNLPMIVHDTDYIKIVVEARGYKYYEEKLNLLGDRYFNFRLAPFATAPTNSP